MDEADCRGESTGETAAEDSESVAVAMAVVVRRRTGFLGRAVVEGAMMSALCKVEQINWARK